MGLNQSINDDDLTLISIAQAETWPERDLDKRQFKRIVKQKRITNDYEMSIVMNILKKKTDFALTTIRTPDAIQPSDINTIIAGYHTQAHQTDIRLLSLGGRG